MRTLISTIASIAISAILFTSCISDSNNDNDTINADSSSSANISSSSKEGDSSSSFIACVDEDITIGTQIWKKCNLSIEPSGVGGAATKSWCYSNKEANCAKYGRLYDWATAMALPNKCNGPYNYEDPDCVINTPYHQGICPSGYHIPTDGDWNKLLRCVEDGGDCYNTEYYDSPGIIHNSSTAGKHLKAREGWANHNNIENLDSYNFSALPGGYYDTQGYFYHAASVSTWWCANEHEYAGATANNRNIYDESDGVYMQVIDKLYGSYVRCIKD